MTYLSVIKRYYFKEPVVQHDKLLKLIYKNNKILGSQTKFVKTSHRGDDFFRCDVGDIVMLVT